MHWILKMWRNLIRREREQWVKCISVWSDTGWPRMLLNKLVIVVWSHLNLSLFTGLQCVAGVCVCVCVCSQAVTSCMSGSKWLHIRWSISLLQQLPVMMMTCLLLKDCVFSLWPTLQSGMSTVSVVLSVFGLASLTATHCQGLCHRCYSVVISVTHHFFPVGKAF